MMSHRFIPGIASQSLGNPQYHGIHNKLIAAALSDLRSVEIFFEDIEQLAQAYESNPDSLSSRFQQPFVQLEYQHLNSHQQTLLQCASQIRQWCTEAAPGVPSLDVICLQPFMHFEGLVDPITRFSRFQKLEFWILIAKHLGTDLIQIPSNFLPESETTGDRTTIVNDLRQAARIGAAQTPIIRFAHEALCWGTHTNTWDAAWSLVQEVDMPNFGTCIDTFNLAGRVYADPSSTSYMNPNAANAIEESVDLLRGTFSDPAHLAKVFYIELCDGELLDQPISPTHAWYDPEQPPCMTWSRNARLFPFETDSVEAANQDRGIGYLPVEQIFDALLDVGYEGYISFEVFNRSLNQPGPQVVAEHAARAKESWRRCAAYIDQRESRRSVREPALTNGHSPNDEMTATTASASLRGGAINAQYLGISPRL